MIDRGESNQEKKESGSSILHKLEKTGQYVFHGSKTGEISEMKALPPRTWVNEKEVDDGAPCVATSRFADAAIFRALVYDDWTGFG